jgi:hypothetical protein
MCKTKLEEIASNLPADPILNNQDRQRLSKLGFQAKEFVLEAISLSKERPELQSSFVKTEDMEAVLQFHDQVTDVLTAIKIVTSKVSDLQMASGSAIDEMARAVYKNFKIASEHRISGAEIAYTRLKQRYKRASKTAKEKTTTVDTTTAAV